MRAGLLHEEKMGEISKKDGNEQRSCSVEAKFNGERCQGVRCRWVASQGSLGPKLEVVLNTR